MQSVQRQFGKFMKRSADDSQVALLLKDFDQVDKLLDKIVDSTKAWREAWSSLLTHQDRMLTEFEGLYAPIVGSSDASTSHTPVPTPEATLARTTKLRTEYEELGQELLRDLAAIDDRMIDPAAQAKEALIPFKKAIKKRDDRKLDYERHQGRVDSLNKRTKRSERENSSLVKAEDDLSRATDDYHAADEHIRQHLPPLLNAVFSLLPRLLAAQIEIQNDLLAHYYTVIYGYCEQEQFPSNPPQPWDQTIAQWEQACNPVQQELESFACLANGKAVRASSQQSGDRRPSNPLGALNRLRSGNSVPTQSDTKTGSASAHLQDLKPALGARSKSTPYAPQSHAAQSLGQDLPTPPAESATPPVIPLANKPSMSAIAGKKKPPPPPPKPRGASSNATFVTALYDFAGQGAGDLVFNEGDRIRVLKRTESTDDWWEGELRGVKGSFPANYVELAQ
ncbi:hypothetical protein BDV18DRAFT_122303 [Aspergillus unguis]